MWGGDYWNRIVFLVVVLLEIFVFFIFYLVVRRILVMIGRIFCVGLEECVVVIEEVWC